MHLIAKILTNKYLRYPKYFLYGMVIVWNFNYLARTDKEMQEQIAHYRQLNREVVPEKPARQFAIPGYALLFDPEDDTLGYVRHSMLYADTPPGSSGWMSGKIFFWIWAESVRDHRLICDETIRDRANAYPLGELKEGTVIASHYLNDKKSWLLASCDVTVRRDALQVSDQDKRGKSLFQPPIYITSTNQLAGIALLPRTQLFREEELKTSIRVNLYLIIHLLALSFIFFLVKARYRRTGNLRNRVLIRCGLIASGAIIAIFLSIFIP